MLSLILPAILLGCANRLPAGCPVPLTGFPAGPGFPAPAFRLPGWLTTIAWQNIKLVSSISYFIYRYQLFAILLFMLFINFILLTTQPPVPPELQVQLGNTNYRSGSGLAISAGYSSRPSNQASTNSANQAPKFRINQIGCLFRLPGSTLLQFSACIFGLSASI